MSEEEFQHQTNAVLTSGIQMWNSLWRLKSTAFTKETWTRRICKEHYPVPVYRLLAQNTSHLFHFTIGAGRLHRLCPLMWNQRIQRAECILSHYDNAGKQKELFEQLLCWKL
ncbi:uncharacterized protein LOC114008879 isoform X3 [Tupaia chinensis]|uniref:uncharacterized protein LOC114008879 isoform X3 n=1 Tax=Tupaia chinensis TaxID=246437 RepID=UPI000FFC929F|nr:uncharacterized protein LOC114008879 isoform X3 [Tupaia chinensis]